MHATQSRMNGTIQLSAQCNYEPSEHQQIRNHLKPTQTVTWISFLLGGIALSLYIQAARAVSMYFLKMDAVHPGDISQEEKVAAMKGEQ